MPETLHRFIKGMNKDADKSLRDPHTYFDAVNFRISEGGDLELFRDDSRISSSIGLNFSHSIVGHCIIRDTMIVFTKSAGVSMIYKGTISSYDVLSGFTNIYSDAATEDGSTLDFGDDIKAVGRYESEDIIKVYWIDGSKPIRYMNVAIHNTTDGLVKSMFNEYIAVNKLEFLPYFYPEDYVQTTVLQGGTLKAGVVQYTYQYYNKYGAETTFAPITTNIPLAESVITTNGYKHRGSEPETNANKSVKLNVTINADNTYEYIRVIRLHYSTYGALPTVGVVADFNIVSSTITIVDNGTTISELTPEEISILGKVIFSAKDITTKENRLFVANINEEYFDVDFDARAFRFPESDSTTYLLSGFTNYTYTLLTDDTAGWAAIMSTDEDDIATKITPRHDCINMFNDLGTDDKSTYSADVYNCEYQWSSTERGGSGPNVKYKFITEEFILDDQANDEFLLAGNTTVRRIGCPLSTDPNNNSFTNYTSPYMVSKYTGYMRDEIYRFGVVFFDQRGRESSVKWIGDIRFPKRSDGNKLYDIANYNSIDDTIESKALGIEFYLRNIPAETVAYQIVRVKRTTADKTIISQGVVSVSVGYGTGNDEYASPQFPVCAIDNVNLYTDNIAKEDVLRFISPEISYGTFEYKEGDYFEHISHFTTYGTSNNEANEITPDTEIVIKYAEESDADYNILTPENLYIVTPVYAALTKSFASFGSSPYQHIVKAGPMHALAGTSAVFDYIGTLGGYTSFVAGDPQYRTFVFNVRRQNYAQYLGRTFDSRRLNEYISCGALQYDTINYTSGYLATGTETYGGDTYISMFENLWGHHYEDEAEYCRIVYFPVESTYNLNYASGYTFSTHSDEAGILIVTEHAGEHVGDFGTATYSLNQTEDFYVYNSVYSNQDNLKVYFAENLEDPDITEFDSRVLYSDAKINNELIDSWTSIRVNSFLDVDSKYGPINNIVNFKDRLFFFQDHGFGALASSERTLLIDENNTGSIVTGTGGVMNRYDYISTTRGNVNSRGIVLGQKGIYWVDNSIPAIMLYNGELFELDREKGNNAIMKEIEDNIEYVLGAFESRHGLVHLYFKLISGDLTGALLFDENKGEFVGWLEYEPEHFIEGNKKLFSVRDEDSYNYIYSHGSASTTYPSASLTILNSEHYPIVKVWDNLEFSTISTETLNIGKDIFNDTFSTIQVYNSYQSSGPAQQITAANLKRRERLWTTIIPRNIVYRDVSTNPDIFSYVNLSSHNKFKDRMRDNHLYIVLGYTGGDYDFSVQHVKVTFRESKR